MESTALDKVVKLGLDQVKGGWRHSTEVAFVRLTQQPQVRILASRDFSLISGQSVDSIERSNTSSVQERDFTNVFNGKDLSVVQH